MMPYRNFILFTCLMLFLLWYVSSWAYQSYYQNPRKELGTEIAQLSGEIKSGENNLTEMKNVFQQYQGYYTRSLPRISNDAQSRYNFWLLELMQYSGFENNTIRNNPSVSMLPFDRGNYEFAIQCTGTLQQLSYFLFEFYCAPFLHRITSLTFTPIENDSEKLSLSFAINALSLRPYQQDGLPAASQLPTELYPQWYIPRQASQDILVYQKIAERNPLQTAKGGIDRADYTVLTAIIHTSNQPEVWFSVQTDDSVIKAKLGETIQSGSFTGKVTEIFDQDVILDREGNRWLLTTGESLQEAFALPPETAEKE